MVLGSLAVYLVTALHLVKSRHRMILLGVLMVIALGQVAVGLIQFSRGNDFPCFFRLRKVSQAATGRAASMSLRIISLVIWK